MENNGKKSVSIICSALSSVIAVARVLSFILFLKFCVRLSFPFARGQNGKGNESYVRADDDADNETVNHNIPRNTIIDRSGGFYTRRAGILVFSPFSDYRLFRILLYSGNAEKERREFTQTEMVTVKRSPVRTISTDGYPL